jgi:hypothetical protein
MATAQSKITRDDIEARLQALQGQMQSATEARKPTLIQGAVALTIILLIVFFLLGKRSGHKKRTVVEIRRI